MDIEEIKDFRPLILVAEDDDSNFKLIKAIIGKKCDILWAKNGEEMLNLYREHTQDAHAILMDIKMPIMTGIELAGWIYQNKPDTKVIIVSGYSDFEYARKALEYKVFDYLLKPISKDKVSELTARIKSEIGSKSKMSDDNNTIVVLACAGAYLLYGSEVLLPGERFWTDSGIDTFMDNLLTPSEEYIFFNSNMLSERLTPRRPRSR